MSIFNPEHNAFNPSHVTEQLRDVRTDAALTCWGISLNEYKLGHRSAQEVLSEMNSDIDHYTKTDTVYIDQLIAVRDRFQQIAC